MNKDTNATGQTVPLDFAGSVSFTKQDVEDPVQHSWVYSGYKNCGRIKMTSRQQRIYDDIIGRCEG